jgi:hypothetical protein
VIRCPITTALRHYWLILFLHRKEKYIKLEDVKDKTK